MWINYVSHAPFAIKKQYQHFPAATETPIHRKSYRLASFSREKGGGRKGEISLLKKFLRFNFPIVSYGLTVKIIKTQLIT